MNNLSLKTIQVNGQVIPVTDSREVALKTGKEHSELLKDIRKYIGYLAEGDFHLGDFFIEDTYKDKNNQLRPCYQLTKQGCEMVANKNTGGIIMDKLVGVRWGDLSEETKEFLLENSNVWDDIKEGECIVDLTENLSVSGCIKCVNKEEGDYEYLVDNDAIIYNSEDGIIEKAKEIDLDIYNVMTVNEAAEIWGKTEGAIRAAIKAKKFILGVDYRKAGRITLITREAMEKVYGKLENK